MPSSGVITPTPLMSLHDIVRWMCIGLDASNSGYDEAIPRRLAPELCIRPTSSLDEEAQGRPGID
jgi:hypothetical protein